MVEIVLPGGDSPLVMRSCSVCDARGWSRQGRTIDLTEALDDLSEAGRARRGRHS
jgi:hypothetical protein